jgi:pullulanase/glycogen debranching enzyme
MKTPEAVMAKTKLVGRSSPLGATVVDGGANFSLFSRPASGVELLFFDREDDATPSRVVRIDPATNRTHHYWQTAPTVPGCTYRVEARSVVMLFTSAGAEAGPSMTGGPGG